MIAAVIAAAIVPVSKNRVSLSYVLIALSLSALVYLAIDLGSRAVAKRSGLLCWWGENALALYVLHLVVLALVVVPPAPWWYAEAPAGLSALQLMAILALMSAAAWWLHGRRSAIGL